MIHPAGAVCALLLLAAPLIAQQSSSPAATSPAPRSQDSTAIQRMRRALWDLVIAQEAYFSAHDRYTGDARTLAVSPGARGQVSTEVAFASTLAWSGRATDPTLKGKNCVIFVGKATDLPDGVPKTAAAGIAAKRPGEPVCDEP